MYKLYTFKHTQTASRLICEAQSAEHAKDLLGGLVGMPEKWNLEKITPIPEETE